ncbi:MAG: ATP-binding protein, partial [Desulfobacteraceae bacterium]
MEHIGDILRRKRDQINTSRADTDTWSGANAEETPSGPVCPVCGGFGFVYVDVPVGHPDFGKAVPCRCAQEEFERECQARLQRYSNLGSLTRFTFASLLPQGRSTEPQNQQRFSLTLEAAKAFAVEPKGWLVLIGPGGSGKTHLAAAIANERINNGYPAFFQSVPDLLDHLRSAFSPDSEIPYDELFERVRNVPLLVLDDLGAQTSTPWTMEKLDQLLNHRFNNELPTVITTSTPVAELEESLRSRLTDPQLSRLFLLAERATPRLEYGWGEGFELQK